MSATIRTANDAPTEQLQPISREAPDRQTLIERHRGLAQYLARKYTGRGEPLDDLTQVAHIGLVKAADRYDPAHGVAFPTYATPTILGELKRHFRDKGWPVRIPRRLQEHHLHIRSTIADLHQQLGRSPTPHEIAEHAHLTLDDVLETMETGYTIQPVSLDTPPDTDDYEPASRLGTSDPHFDTAETRATLTPALNELPERERIIISLRYYRDYTQAQIAEELGISQMHVSRLLTRTLRTLRQLLGSDPEAADGTEATP